MQLQRILRQFERFQVYLGGASARENLHVWESLHIFQQKWNEQALDFPAMYQACLDNSQTRRLWSRENFEPKRVMLELARWQPHLARELFIELYNEEKSPEGRIDRFRFHCDQLLADYRERHPKSLAFDHYHGDYQMIFLYLAFRYPERYALYDFNAFQASLRLLGATNPPFTHDPERYVKTTRTIFQLMKKQEGLLEAHQRRLDPGRHYMGEAALLAYEFYRVVGRG
jgi:hypothetical protein